MKELLPITQPEEEYQLPLLLELLHNDPTAFWQESLRTMPEQDVKQLIREAAYNFTHNTPPINQD